MTTADLKPRTVGELLDAAFYVYRRQFLRLVIVTLVVSFPALVVAALNADTAALALNGWWEKLMSSSHKNQRDPMAAFTDSMHAMDGLMPILVLSQILQAIERASGVVLMAIVGTHALERRLAPSVWSVLAQAAPRLPAAVLLQFVLDNVLGCCMYCLPVGVVLTVLVLSSSAAIAVERGPLEASLREKLPAWIRWVFLPFAEAIDGVMRSVQLTWNVACIGRGTIFWFFLVSFVGIADAAAMTIGGVLGGGNGSWFWAQHCSEALVLPAWGLGIAFWHADLRVRREGLDLQVAA